MISSALKIAPVLVAALLAVPPPAFAEPIPTSSRSRAAIAQAAPALRQDMAQMGLRFGAPIFVRLFKEEREFEVWVEDGPLFRLFRTYPICNYAGTLGPKLKEGDGQSPEGFYFVRPRQLQPWSDFYLSFNLGFPNAYDRGHRRAGSYLMVHGSCVSIGCYAMTNEKIEEIFAPADAAFRGGQTFFRVHAFPFRPTEERLTLARSSKWLGFWRNLKQGHDYFERSGRPPNVGVRDGRYVFSDDR